MVFGHQNFELQTMYDGGVWLLKYGEQEVIRVTWIAVRNWEFCCLMFEMYFLWNAFDINIRKIIKFCVYKLFSGVIR